MQRELRCDHQDISQEKHIIIQTARSLCLILYVTGNTGVEGGEMPKLWVKNINLPRYLSLMLVLKIWGTHSWKSHAPAFHASAGIFRQNSQ